MKLPIEFVNEGLRLSKENFLFGIPLEDLTKEELIAALAHIVWKPLENFTCEGRPN